MLSIIVDVDVDFFKCQQTFWYNFNCSGWGFREQNGVLFGGDTDFFRDERAIHLCLRKGKRLVFSNFISSVY